MNHLRKINLDKAAIGFIIISASLVLGEAYTRTSLSDAQTAKECRYPPVSQIVNADHVKELEKRGIVVIRNVLTEKELDGSRKDVKQLSKTMETSNYTNDNDVRQDQICLVREGDEKEHGDDFIHCIKLLRGIPYVLKRLDYSTSSSFVVPQQCQLARYLPDGSVYVRHLDKCNFSLSEMGLVGWLRASDYRYRTVTAILYLNSRQWKSQGKLRCFDTEENCIDVNPIGGTLVLFDSSKVEHQVQPSTEERYALTLWINGIMNES